MQAFPCISTGIYGYPPDKAAPVAIETVKAFIENNPEKVSFGPFINDVTKIDPCRAKVSALQ